MTVEPKSEITALLHAWRSGQTSAIDQLMPLLYEQLHSLASGYMRRERSNHTIRATALVNEAYLKLMSSDFIGEDRVHFLAIAAITMRRILVDHARAHRRDKRGGGANQVTWEDCLLLQQPQSAEILDLDLALKRLALQDARKAKVIELVYFGGMTGEEASKFLGVSLPTINRELRLAKAWLRQELDSTFAVGGASLPIVKH